MAEENNEILPGDVHASRWKRSKSSGAELTSYKDCSDALKAILVPNRPIECKCCGNFFTEKDSPKFGRNVFRNTPEKQKAFNSQRSWNRQGQSQQRQLDTGMAVITQKMERPPTSIPQAVGLNLARQQAAASSSSATVEDLGPIVMVPLSFDLEAVKNNERNGWKRLRPVEVETGVWYMAMKRA